MANPLAKKIAVTPTRATVRRREFVSPKTAADIIPVDPGGPVSLHAEIP
jgi:hypothetical protein